MLIRGRRGVRRCCRREVKVLGDMVGGGGVAARVVRCCSALGFGLWIGDLGAIDV